MEEKKVKQTVELLWDSLRIYLKESNAVKKHERVQIFVINVDGEFLRFP